MAKLSRRRFNRYIKLHPVKTTGVAVLVIAIVLAVLELTNTTHLFHKSSIPPVIPVTTNPTSAQNNNSQSSQQPTSPKDSATSSTSGSSKVTLPLYAPYGDFVSNHHPNLSGAPAPSQETSVCNTTPGAKCYIKFTMGSTHTSLPAKTADSKGTVYWSWDVKKAGFSKGDWTITAVATLNGQTKAVQDTLPLSVGN